MNKAELCREPVRLGRLAPAGHVDRLCRARAVDGRGGVLLGLGEIDAYKSSSILFEVASAKVWPDAVF